MKYWLVGFERKKERKKERVQKTGGTFLNEDVKHSDAADILSQQLQ
jgi:hypothetical protein